LGAPVTPITTPPLRLSTPLYKEIRIAAVAMVNIPVKTLIMSFKFEAKRKKIF
jgi:hypothetical protein